MGRLKSLTILLTLGAWGGAATDGAPPDDAPATAARPAPPAPPGEYVKAAVKLARDGQDELAAKYFKAASDYRDMLTADEQAALDQHLAKPAAPPAAAPPAAAVPELEPAPTPEPTPAPTTPMARGGTSADPKQQARWLLQSAREQARMGNLDEAERLVGECRSLNVRWGLFELDTPSKVEDAIAKLRASAASSGPAGAGRDKATAKAKLKEARELLSANQHDKAEAIAVEVGAWNLPYGMVEDNPRKVAAAARALRKREQVRHAGPRSQPSLEVYDLMVTEARQLMGTGRLDEAESKARQASRMGVSPSLTSDRAELVLHEVAMLRARGSSPAAAPSPTSMPEAPPAIANPAVAAVSNPPAPAEMPAIAPAPAPPGVAAADETPAAKAEREGNELLAQGQVEAAKAKFAEAERLHASTNSPLSFPAPTAADPGVQAAADGNSPAPVQPASPGESGLEQAKGLLAGGNYAAARQEAEQVRDGGFGLEGQANELLSQIALAEQAGGFSLYEAALDALRKGDTVRAHALLTEMASTNLDEATAQKVQDLLVRLPKNPSNELAGQAVVGATETDAEAVAAQKLNAEVGTKVAEARRLLETDPDKAIKLLESTGASVQAANLNPAVARTMNRRVEVAIELAKKDKAAFDAKMQDKQFREEIEQKRLRILEADKQKKAQMGELMTKAQDAYNEGRLEEAEKLAKKAAEIDPNEVAAHALVTLARSKRHYGNAKNLRELQNESNLIAWEEVDKTGIVSTKAQREGIDFGDAQDWKGLTERRSRLVDKTALKRTPSEVAIVAKLKDPISLNVNKQPLGEVIDYLRNWSGLNIVVDQSALAEEGLTLASPVDLQVKDMKLSTALKLLLSPLHLTYQVDDEVLMLTSPSANQGKMIVYAHNVADLIVPVRGLNSPRGLKPEGEEPPDGEPKADGEDIKPADADGSWKAKPGHDGITPDMFVPLIQIIKTTIAPGTWSNADGLVPTGTYGMGAGLGDGLGGETAEGQVGTITPFFLNISLIIRHTAEVHEQVVDLLRQLRRLQDLQVSIEVRFITVSDSFFEQIGVDFDFSVQSDVVGRQSSFAIPNPAATPGATTGGGGGGGGATGVNPFLINPIRDHAIGNRPPLTVGRVSNGDIGNFRSDLQMPFLQNTADNITPFNIVPNLAATFGIAFLSDLEVYLFLTAIQGDVRGNLVQAPKVTTFNGAPAAVVNTRNRNFVSQLVPIVSFGTVAFTPQIQQFQDGVQLFVTPVVSADRRYVRVSLAPIFQTLIRFDTFTIPAAVGGGGGLVGGGGAATINAQIQLPVFDVTTVDTTVTVPDGGTVLLGGVKRLNEQRQEFGVPILAKTPFINRLFRNIGIGRESSSLMLMVTPRIIILEEEEERLGIPTVTF